MDWKILTLVYEQPAHLVVTHDNVSVIQAELVMVAQIRGVKVKVFANVPVRRAIEVQLRKYRFNFVQPLGVVVISCGFRRKLSL